VIGEDDDELDLEERERIARVEKEQQDRMRALYEKSEEDQLKKKQRKEQGTK
jgi:hypothetical protein